MDPGRGETRRVAEEAGISKGTLTGVARTLQARGLMERKGHPTDGRLALLALTPEGEQLMTRVFPEFNAEEAFVTEGLSDDEALDLADLLGRIVVQVESRGEDRRLELLDGQDPGRGGADDGPRGRQARPAHQAGGGLRRAVRLVRGVGPRPRLADSFLDHAPDQADSIVPVRGSERRGRVRVSTATASGTPERDRPLRTSSRDRGNEKFQGEA